MKQAQKLSLAELKSKAIQSNNVIANIEAIKGGADDEYCHEGNGKPAQQTAPTEGTFHGTQELHNAMDQFMKQYGPR